MKPVIVYQDTDGGVYTTEDKGMFVGNCMQLPEAATSKDELLIKLAGMGMSSEDLIRLKHGGVL